MLSLELEWFLSSFARRRAAAPARAVKETA